MHHSTTRALLLVVLIIGSASVAGVGMGVAGADTVALQVEVLDQDGDPVGDATLSITWDGGSTSETTASNGRTYVDVPDDKEIEIEVDAQGYVRNEPFTLENPGDHDSVEVPVYDTAWTTVTVKDANGPLSNADVRLVKDDVAVIDGKTDASGVIESDMIEVGEYELEVVKKGYLRNTTTLEVRGNARPEVTLEKKFVTATFTVDDEYFEPAQPVDNATVTVESRGNVRTTASGEATIQVPVNSKPKVTISKAGYSTLSFTMTVDEEAPTFDVSISRKPTLKVSTGQDRIVVGENVSVDVTDEYGDLVSGATVSVNGETVGSTDAQGSISVQINEAGNVTITAETNETAESVTVQGIDPDAEDETTTATETEPDDDSSSSGWGPGFGPLVAILALIAVAMWASRRE